MARIATLALLLLLLFILAAPTYDAGYTVSPAKGRQENPPTVSPDAVTPDHGSRPAIRPLAGQGSPLGSDLSNFTSENWSGYVVSGGAGSVTSVNGSWTVPSVTCPRSDAYSAFWVGIDGFSPTSQTVEQIGTESDCQGGTPDYYAWFEFYPANSVYINNVSVLPGDAISASVYCMATGLQVQCTVSIEDINSGQFFTTTWAFGLLGILGNPVLLTSAEWITEAPSSENLTILPLADFGTVRFGSDYASVDGVTGNVGSFGNNVSEVTMTSDGMPNGRVDAQPSALSPDGRNFSIAWESGQFPVLLARAITPQSPKIVVGEQIQLTANPSGGVPPYSIHWYSAATNGTCSGLDSIVAVGPTYAPSPSASTYYCYTVTDSASPQSYAASRTDLVTVLPALSPGAVTASPGAVYVGESALLSTSSPFSGGASPYSCQWLYSPPAASNFSDLGAPFTDHCKPSSKLSVSTGTLTTLGNWSFELQVTDRTGATVVSPAATLSVVPLPSSIVTLSCSPTPVVVGSATNCKATVQTLGSSSSSLSSASVPTGSIAWSSSGSGSFSHTSCKLKKGVCSVKFTPNSAGSPVGLLASYSGDFRDSPSTGAYVLNVTEKASKTVVSCSATGISGGSPKEVTCKAKVTGYSPTGTVSWSQGGGSSGGSEEVGAISFVNSTCTIFGGSCSVDVTGVQPGKVAVQASYGGDSNDKASNGTEGIKVGKESAAVTIACSPILLGSSSAMSCRATVSGYSPTGTVTWSKVSGPSKVTISPKSCKLSPSPWLSEGTESCTVLILTTSTHASSVSVKASYEGDESNLKGSAVIKLDIG
jgi:hypothetical protein